MLLDSERAIEGSEGALLFEVFAAVVTTLEDRGHPPEEADAIAHVVLPRLHDRLGAAGLIVRHLGRHADPSS